MDFVGEHLKKQSDREKSRGIMTIVSDKSIQAINCFIKEGIIEQEKLAVKFSVTYNGETTEREIKKADLGRETLLGMLEKLAREIKTNGPKGPEYKPDEGINEKL